MLSLREANMTSNWKIPSEMEMRIRKRDKCCVYCHVRFRGNKGDKATWEHIDNNANNISEKNIALCCRSCNSSKGNKKLLDWFDSEYCKNNKINERTVANVIKRWIKKHKR